MNDPFTSAIRSIGQNISKIAGGENPLFAPQLANLFGFNLPGVPIISARDYFLTQMESWNTSIPINTQWIVIIDKYPKCINTAILQGLERTGGDKKGFDISRAVSILTAYPLQNITGCIFAQGVEIPPDSLTVGSVNIQNNAGYTPAPIASERVYPNQLTMQFLETNTSFTDFVLRPWVIAASHFGFVARDPNNNTESIKNVKANVTILQFTRTFQGIAMIPRKIWRFYNCCPIEIGSRSMTYDDAGSLTEGRGLMSTKWVYSHYTLETNFYFPLVSIIDRISKGTLPSILAPLSKNLDIRGIF